MIEKHGQLRPVEHFSDGSDDRKVLSVAQKRKALKLGTDVPR